MRLKKRSMNLKKISKARVETMGEGVDAYWLMSKDLDHKVNYIDGRMTTLTNIVIEMAAEKEEILNILQEQQATLIELSARLLVLLTHALGRGKKKKKLKRKPPTRKIRY